MSDRGVRRGLLVTPPRRVRYLPWIEAGGRKATAEGDSCEGRDVVGELAALGAVCLSRRVRQLRMAPWLSSADFRTLRGLGTAGGRDRDVQPTLSRYAALRPAQRSRRRLPCEPGRATRVSRKHLGNEPTCGAIELRSDFIVGDRGCCVIAPPAVGLPATGIAAGGARSPHVRKAQD